MQPNDWGEWFIISDANNGRPGGHGPPLTMGLFDSGVGGLTVVGEVFRQLPDAPIVYYGDTAHVPYGGRATAQLIRFAERIIGFLIEQGAGYIVFACNTSSAVSLDPMRRRFNIPMVGLIAPGAEAAVAATANKRVGVIATGATVASGAYARAIQSLAPGIRVFSRPAPKLVPLIEAGQMRAPETGAALLEYLHPLKDEGIDTLIMGCTHYPFLAQAIARIMGPGVTLVDPARATVRTARRELMRLGCRGDQSSPARPRHRYYVSADPSGFAHVARLLLGPNAPIAARRVHLGE